MNKELTDFILKKKKQSDDGGGIDWDARRDTSLTAVNGLYQQIETILADPIAKKTIMMERRKKNLAENYIGTYAADDLILLIGGEQVRFSPVGRNVVGASGRVDVVGDRDSAVLIAQIDGRWGFVTARQPTLRVVPFDEPALTKVLQRVMRN
jgi:hypothetical protein